MWLTIDERDRASLTPEEVWQARDRIVAALAAEVQRAEH
jgi:hypothetical protein